jgi:hypothetical protein
MLKIMELLQYILFKTLRKSRQGLFSARLRCFASNKVAVKFKHTNITLVSIATQRAVNVLFQETSLADGFAKVVALLTIGLM